MGGALTNPVNFRPKQAAAASKSHHNTTTNQVVPVSSPKHHVIPSSKNTSSIQPRPQNTPIRFKAASPIQIVPSSIISTISQYDKQPSNVCKILVDDDAFPPPPPVDDACKKIKDFEKPKTRKIISSTYDSSDGCGPRLQSCQHMTLPISRNMDELLLNADSAFVNLVLSKEINEDFFPFAEESLHTIDLESTRILLNVVLFHHRINDQEIHPQARNMVIHTLLEKAKKTYQHGFVQQDLHQILVNLCSAIASDGRLLVPNTRNSINVN